jgi:hypothetical protein
VTADEWAGVVLLVGAGWFLLAGCLAVVVGPWLREAGRARR